MTEINFSQITLKTWIDEKFIKSQKGLAANPCIKAIEMVLDPDLVKDDYQWFNTYEDILFLNTNPYFLETVLKKIWVGNRKYKRYIFAKNISPEMVKLCVEYYDTCMKNTNPFGCRSPKDAPYDSQDFMEWNDFCKNLSSNPSASIMLLDYLSKNDGDLTGSRDGFTHTDWLNIHRIIKNCNNLTFDDHPEIIDYIKNKIVDKTLDINEVAGMSDDLIVDIILDNIDSINFTGNIGYNTNNRLKDVLEKNIDQLDIYKCIENSSDFFYKITEQKIERFQGVVYWNFVKKSDRWIRHIKKYYDQVGWEKCCDIKLLEENLDKITDLSALQWNIISHSSDIFEKYDSENCGIDILTHYETFIGKLPKKFSFYPF